jgi:CheY-like chemotaxis protein
MHIVLIDDSEIDLFLNEKLLEKGLPESKVTKIQDSSEALQLVNNSDEIIDLIICDKQMPKLSGFDLAKKIGDTIPFVILTASIMEQDRESASSIPGLELWEKPLNPERVKQRLN